MGKSENYHSKTVTVIGGGIAGLSAATRLAEEGYTVTLLEKRSVLGGRASSILDPEGTEWVDNCQHILLKCCNSLMNFYRRLGVESKIVFYDEFIFISPKGKISRLKGSQLPSPLHMLGSFLRLKFLNFKDKVLILKGLFQIITTRERKLQELDHFPFLEWLKKTKQTTQAIDRFWRVILVSALNETLENLSSKYAFKTFRETFFKGISGYHMGIPKVPLSELYFQPSITFLEKRNGRVLFQKKVTRLEIKDALVHGVQLADASSIQSDYYILALPFNELLEVLPLESIKEHNFFGNFKKLKTSPITGIHLFFDRKITNLPHAVLLDSKLQWMFNKTKNFSKNENSSQYLQLVTSASREFIPLSKANIIELALHELQKFFPTVRAAKLLKAIVIKELHATFSPQPNADEWRPTQKTPFKNLVLAGDWTKTDWPATMESAVISGEKAAEEIMKSVAGPYC